MAQTTDYTHIRQYGFIKCDYAQPHMRRPKQLGYCLHCKRLFSLSWAQQHSRRLRGMIGEISAFFNEEKVPLYCHDISSDLELRVANGRVWSSTGQNENADPLIDPNGNGQFVPDQLNNPLSGLKDQPNLSSTPLPSAPVQVPTDDEQGDVHSQQAFECAQDCILKDSFYRSEFDGERFLSIAESVTCKLLSGSDKTKIDTFKARVITSLIRKMSNILSLTKSQNDQLLSFWKAMIVYIHPKSEVIADKIRASYSTCLRQSLKDEKANDSLCRRYMEECSHFSIAVDSALIRREHVLSCFIRFAFHESVLQIPLFFSVCSLKSGNDIALFLMDKLLEHGAVFGKLISVSTDGAANMNGIYNGMAACLKRLVKQQCEIRQEPVNDCHDVWCFAHRLNLVSKDFLGLKGVSVVKRFADWFCDRPRQVSYKTFVTQKNTPHKLKSIPQPSQTRWLFYADVLSAILSQRQFVEEFLETQECFPSFWSSLLKKENFGMFPESLFSFENVRLCSLFLFADYILGVLGKVNVFFQRRYLMVWEAWNVVRSLQKHISFVFSRIHQPQPAFSHLSSLDKRQKDTFGNLLEQLSLSLSCRFVCLSQSVIKRSTNTEPNIGSASLYSDTQSAITSLFTHCNC